MEQVFMLAKWRRPGVLPTFEMTPLPYNGDSRTGDQPNRNSLVPSCANCTEWFKVRGK